MHWRVFHCSSATLAPVFEVRFRLIHQGIDGTWLSESLLPICGHNGYYAQFGPTAYDSKDKMDKLDPGDNAAAQDKITQPAPSGEGKSVLSEALGSLSESELADLRDRLLPQEVERRKEAKKSQARVALDALAAKYGFSIDELYPDPSRIPLPRDQYSDEAHVPVPGLSSRTDGGHESGKNTTRQAKFRSPHDPKLEWCGRGRKPLWLVHYLETGGSIEALKVEETDPPPVAGAT